MLIKIISKQKNPYKQAGFIAVVIGLLVFGVVVTGTYAYKHRSFVLNKFKQVQNFSKSKTNPSEQLAKNTDEKAVSSKQEREPEGQVLSVVDNRSYINQAVMEEFQRLVAAGALTGPQGVKGEKGDKGENSETRNTSQNYPVGLPSNNLGQVLGATITATPSYNPPSPQGPTTTNIPSIQQGYVPAGLVPNNDQGFNGAVLGGFTSLGVKNITSDKITVSERVTTNNLTVSGSSSFAGDLSVTGSFSSGSLTATTAQVATGGKVVNLNVVTPTGGFQNDSQHWIDVGSDNLPRIVYFDTSSTRLRLLRCLNVNCSSSNITNIIDNEPNNVDAPVLVLGPDGFPRVAYITYDSPSELRFVKCNDADCATKTDNLIDVATSTGLTSYHILSIAIGSDGFARILYDNFAGTSALKLAVCNNAACTAPTLNTIATGGNYFQTHTIQMGTDGFPKIMYNDYSTTPDDVHFINCLDANCSANTNTIVTTATGLYESSMALGSDGFGRLFFGDTVLGYRFIQCTNANCSTSVATIVDSNTNAYNVSLRMGIDDLPRLMYTTSAGTYYIRCLNAACSSKNTVTIKSSEGNPPDFDIDSEGLPHLVYTTNTQTQISYTKLLNETGFALISTPGSGLGTSTNPFGQIFANGVTLYENTYLVPTKGVLSIGSSAAAFDGSTSGYFTGSDYGTQIAVNAASGFSGNLMDLQVAGASKFKVTADGVVSFLGGLDLGNLTPRSVTRTLPVTVNDTVDIGSFTLTNGAATFDVSVTVASSGFSVSKNYSIPVQFNQTSGQWYSVMPTRSTNNHNGNDLALEINVNSATMSLRIRRIGGSTAGTAYITMLQQGVSNDTFTASTTTTTNAAVPTVTLDLFSDRLKVAGLQPGTVTSGNGVAAADVLNITAGAGGNTGTSPASTAGAGGAILLTLGAGGSPTAATTTANAGAGGAFTLQGGAGGSAAVAGTGTNTGGAGSTLTFNAGAGGAATGATSNTNTGGVGGAITLQAGVGGAATTGSGGLNGGTGGGCNNNRRCGRSWLNKWCWWSSNNLRWSWWGWYDN